MWTRTFVVALLVIVGGCTDSSPADDADSNGSSATQAPTQAPSGPPTLADLAAKTGCTPEARENPFARESGGCKSESGTYRLETYNDTDAMNRWYDTWKSTTGGGVVVWGDRWIAHASDMPTADFVKSKLGGEIR